MLMQLFIVGMNLGITLNYRENSDFNTRNFNTQC